MVELRWVYHDMKEGGPPQGAINVGGSNMGPPLFQKLQYRVRVTVFGSHPAGPDVGVQEWSTWKDVPHGGFQ